MKIQFQIFTFLLLSIVSFAQEEEIRYFYPDHEFKKGEKVLMYGNNVVLRSAENPTSEALDTLKIAEAVTIIKKGETMSDLNGRSSYWYKVKYKNKIGYVLGGWISLDHKQINDKTYLIIFSERGDQLFARTRVVSKDKSYYGHEIPLSTYLISLDILNNHGLEGVEAIFVVSMHAEACGVVGGSVFLFDSGERLFEAIRTESMSEAGLFWFSESIDFKGADYWEENCAFFSRENGEYMDDSLEWTRMVTNTVKMVWDGEKFTPDVRKMSFELGD